LEKSLFAPVVELRANFDGVAPPGRAEQVVAGLVRAADKCFLWPMLPSGIVTNSQLSLSCSFPHVPQFGPSGGAAISPNVACWALFAGQNFPATSFFHDLC
jgi:hypothetical protein